MSNLPETLKSLVSQTDTKQVILERFDQREKQWRQEMDALKEADKKKEKLLKSLNEELQLNRINAATEQSQPQETRIQSIVTTSGLISPSGKQFKRTPAVFSGLMEEDVRLWLARMDNFLQDEGLGDKKMIRSAVSFLEGAALQWYTNVAHDLKAAGIELTWDLFVEKCIERWGGINTQERMRVQLDQLRQTRSVSEYNNEFQKLIGHLGGEYKSEAFKMHQYLRGLKQHVRVHAAVLKFESLQDCMSAMTAYEDALNIDQQRGQQWISRPQKTATFRRPFTSKSSKKGRGTFTPTGRRLFVMGNSPKSSEQGLSSIWNDAVQVYGFEKAKQMYENELYFKCGRKGHRASECRSQQFTPELSGNSNFESENYEGRDEYRTDVS